MNILLSVLYALAGIAVSVTAIRGGRKVRTWQRNRR